MNPFRHALMHRAAPRVIAALAASLLPMPTRARADSPSIVCTHRNVHSDRDEWMRCLGVEATIANVPAVGGQTVLTVVVSSDIDAPDADLVVDLPSTLELVEPQSHSMQSARAMDGVHEVVRWTGRVSLSSRSTLTKTFIVRALSAGEQHIAVRVLALVLPGRTDAASDDVRFTIGAIGVPSMRGVSPGPTDSGAVPVPPGAVMAPVLRSSREGDRAPAFGTPSNDDPPTAGPRAATGQSCAYGHWYYVDNNGWTRPSMNQVVQAWDKDTYSADDLLAAAVVDYNGFYRLCFPNDDADPLSTGPQEVYLRFYTENSVWRVRDTPLANTDYTVTTTVNTICDACEQDYGNLQPGSANHMRAMHAFDEVNNLWVYVHGTGTCFDRNDVSCRQMVVNWTPTSTDGTYYDRATNDIHLAAADPDSQITVVHEASHALMDDVYSDLFPPAVNCNPHYVSQASSQGCAWVEGFAEWLPMMVYNDNSFRWPAGDSLNLEDPTWGWPDWGNGDAVEGRVAGAMLDLADSLNEGPWDVAGEGAARQYDTFQNAVSNTFPEFLLQDRPSRGYPLGTVNERSSAYQNTIDYGFSAVDLKMTALTSAKLSTPGGGLAITSQVSNQGLGVVASDFEVGYYLSPDSTITTSDRIMTQVCIVHGIGQGTNLSCEGVLTVPVDTPNGTYYFGAIVDRLNVVSETNEANNTILASTGTVVIQTPCPEGTACNDGVYCNGTDTCSGGACSVHAGNPCPGADGDGNCAESCNEATDTCSAADPNGSTCNDGAYCNGTDSCSGGACSVHGGNPCPGADGDANCAESCNEATDTCSAADPNGSACNDGAYCNGSDTCSGGACSVHGGNPCPGADGDANCAESCNETTDGCNAFDPSGSSCNDSDQCTANDSCKNGQCSGQVTPECPSTTTTTLPGQVCGDANGDGKITTSDALIVLRSAVGTANCLMTVCDFSGDGKVTSADALSILRVAVGGSGTPKCPRALLVADEAEFATTTTSTTVPEQR